MDFDFKKTYSGLSNTELIKITENSSAYQPAAVTAAHELLNERVVTDDDITAARQEHVRAEKLAESTLLYKTNDFLQPVLQPGKTTDATKWINLICAILILQYLWLLWLDAPFVSLFLHEGMFPGSYNIAELIYFPIIAFLFYKGKKWGWVLLLALNFYGFMGKSAIALFRIMSNDFTGTIPSFIISILITGSFIIMLLQDRITEKFIITINDKVKTIQVSAILGLMAAAIIFYNYNRLNQWL